MTIQLALLIRVVGLHGINGSLNESGLNEKDGR